MSLAILVETWPLRPGEITPASSYRFEKPVVVIGRRPAEVDVVLVSDLVSPRAIQLLISAEELVLTDESNNGASINGVRVRRRCVFQSGDEILIHPYGLRVTRLPASG